MKTSNKIWLLVMVSLVLTWTYTFNSERYWIGTLLLTMVIGLEFVAWRVGIKEVKDKEEI